MIAARVEAPEQVVESEREPGERLVVPADLEAGEHPAQLRRAEAAVARDSRGSAGRRPS